MRRHDGRDRQAVRRRAAFAAKSPPQRVTLTRLFEGKAHPMYRIRAHRLLNLPGHALGFVLCVAVISADIAAQPAAVPPPTEAPAAQELPAQGPAAQPPSAQPAPTGPTRPGPGRPVPIAAETLTLLDAPELKGTVAQALAPKAGGLTANEVARRAVVASNSLAVKQAAIRAAAAKVDEVVFSFMPRLKCPEQSRRKAIRSRCLGSMLAWILNITPLTFPSVGSTSRSRVGCARGDGAWAASPSSSSCTPNELIALPK